MEELPITTIVATAGFVAGIVLGAVANKTNFCTMGSLSDMVFMEDYSRFRAWVLAMAVAILGTQALHVMEMISVYDSIYQTTNFGWAGAIIGGVLFGFGMTMAGGCANKNLVRIGGGNLKSIVVVLVMGVTAYMTVRGLFGLVRVEVENATNVDLATMDLQGQGMVDMLAAAIGTDPESIRVAFTAVVALVLLAWVFKDAEFRANGEQILGGLIVGLLIPAGWWITGVLGYDDFDPTALNSFTFVNPAGESIQYLMTFTGTTINFGIATVGGVIVGSFLMAMATKSFAVESFSDAADMKRHLLGSIMMGFGGVMALGCTFGQGITGISTLAAGSLIALLSIIFGGLWGLKSMEEDSVMGGLRAVFARG
jgi:uncharacterized membrane protein YedE/YeeE